MPQIIFTLMDTPSGGVAIHTDFKPAVGAPLTAAQSAALDILARTRREYGINVPVVGEVDMDAIYRTRSELIRQ